MILVLITTHVQTTELNQTFFKVARLKWHYVIQHVTNKYDKRAIYRPAVNM